MWARDHDEHPLEERQLIAKLRIGAFEGRVGFGPVDHHERAATAIEVTIEIGIAEAAEVRARPVFLMGWDLRGISERINAVRVGTDAPGPQPGLELAALQQPTLR